MYSIIQYRKKEVGDGEESVCDFLNNRKYKFFNKLTYNEKNGEKWSKENIKIFFESSDVSKVISTLVKRKRLKFRKRKSVENG